MRYFVILLFTPHAQAVVGVIGIGVFERRMQKFFAAPHAVWREEKMASEPSTDRFF